MTPSKFPKLSVPHSTHHQLKRGRLKHQICNFTLQTYWIIGLEYWIIGQLTDIVWTKGENKMDVRTSCLLCCPWNIIEPIVMCLYMLLLINSILPFIFVIYTWQYHPYKGCFTKNQDLYFWNFVYV